MHGRDNREIPDSYRDSRQYPVYQPVQLIKDFKNTLIAITANKQKSFERLKSYLTVDKASASYRDIAEDLGITEGAVRVAVHRLRKRYRELLRDEIAQTVTSDDKIDEEIRDLFVALGS